MEDKADKVLGVMAVVMVVILIGINLYELGRDHGRREVVQAMNCEYTLIQVRGKPAADGPRYRALGNSMAVNVMCWIGWRIAGAIQRREAA